MFKNNWADNIYVQISLIIVGVFSLIWLIYGIVQIKNKHRGTLQNHKFEIICVTTAEKSGSATVSRGKGLVSKDSTGTSIPRIISGVPENISLNVGDYILCYQSEKSAFPATLPEPFRCWYAQKLDKNLVSRLLKDADLKFGIVKEEK